MGLLERDRTTLLVIDVQEGFRPYKAFGRVVEGARMLVEGARVLGVPILASEQYPQGLGPTAPEIGLADEPRIEKTVFSVARADGFDLGGRDQVLVAGIEAHVCVLQTVLDLLDRGIEVDVCADAVGSRHKEDFKRALPRLERAGAVVTTVETALLELCERAGTPEFKEVQKVIM